MELSVANVVLVAKQHQIEELRRLASTSQFVGVLGHVIHVLQSERGATSIFLASSGERFEAIRQEVIVESESAEHQLRSIFAAQLEPTTFTNAKLLSLMGWVLLGLDDLPDLRKQISKHNLSASESIAAFSRLIAGLVSLIFEVADAAVDPRISGLLVALFSLVQGKELAGQERAIGALSFASGICDGAHQQRVIHLIDAQDRHFKVFSAFAEELFVNQWKEMQAAPYVGQLERLRRVLCTTKPSAALDANSSDTWFGCCSERLTAIWSLQSALVLSLQERCATLIAQAESDLQDSQGLLKVLRENPPLRAGLTDRFFDPALPVEHALSFMAPVNGEANEGRTIIDVLQAQSQRLASMEAELAAARRALDERKAIERAKGILMARFNLTEADAYKKLRTASMEQNRRLAEVAEAILTLASFS
jgi:Nitrate and nitrite sensing/ANTAR domain